MRSLMLVILALLALLAAVSPSPIDGKHQLINRPTPDMIFGGARGGYPVKGNDDKKNTPLALRLRKGEYVCGGRVCKLQPGEVPPGCNGVCQYRV